MYYDIHIHRFLYFENQKIIYAEPTLMLNRACQTQAMHHADTPTTLSELTSLIQPQWSEISSPNMRHLSQVVHKGPQYYVTSPSSENSYHSHDHTYIYVYIKIHSHLLTLSSKSFNFTLKRHIYFVYIKAHHRLILSIKSINLLKCLP